MHSVFLDQLLGLCLINSLKKCEKLRNGTVYFFAYVETRERVQLAGRVHQISAERKPCGAR
jgi:hypothetical protein